MSKKVVVVGAGVAGLSAGVYAQKCGFDVTILESHNLPGGICTSWNRKGYLLEGGMHWLAGSSPSQPEPPFSIYAVTRVLCLSVNKQKTTVGTVCMSCHKKTHALKMRA